MQPACFALCRHRPALNRNCRGLCTSSPQSAPATRLQRAFLSSRSYLQPRSNSTGLHRRRRPARRNAPAAVGAGPAVLSPLPSATHPIHASLNCTHRGSLVTTSLTSCFPCYRRRAARRDTPAALGAGPAGNHRRLQRAQTLGLELGGERQVVGLAGPRGDGKGRGDAPVRESRGGRDGALFLASLDSWPFCTFFVRLRRGWRIRALVCRLLWLRHAAIC